jgi:molybdate transport system regulatory protein
MKISPPPTPKSPPRMPVRKPASAKLMVAHRQPAPKPLQHVRSCIRTKAWVEREGRFVIGEGGVALLSAIAAHGSLAQGARQIGWSYRHAWGYIRRAEAVLGEGLIVTRSGKGTARGASLTEAARLIIKQMRDAQLRASFKTSRRGLTRLNSASGIGQHQSSRRGSED